ncbi:MAG: bifunctional 4-hydroxy-2-oxoglutarate aldolase/2-dehydro-3-deoxy-phosphogluconate aldolase [Cyanobacteria bacterium]|nr:bifunctional 4-hydroxy-2-oxoglutarate aldolase/2-dehydro-3-deoxy-phosphogluconate aldolase [Cyanobacteriota bacterium]
MQLTAQTNSNLLTSLQERPLIAIIRGKNAESCDFKPSLFWLGKTLIDLGVPHVEITLTTPGALALISALCDYRDSAEKAKDCLIGAGSILSLQHFTDAMAAGADFLVSPVLDTDLLEFAQNHNTLLIPGAATPSEIYHAHKLGCPVVKVFPANTLGGVDYIKSILAPMPSLKVIPTGGIIPSDYHTYLKAGAFAVGLGSQLLPPGCLKAEDTAALKKVLEPILDRATV